MSRARWNGYREPARYCEGSGKVIYDKRGAQTAANHRYEQEHVKLRIYTCPYCHQWHLTHTNIER